MTEVIGVVGLGTMGAGVAQVALENGHEVVAYDVDETAVERSRERILSGLARRAARLGLDPDSIDAWAEGRLATMLRQVPTLDALGAEAEIIIECAIEDLALKQTIFGTLDAATGDRPDVILASNTSALPVSAIAARTTRPDRVVGLHFFNPVAAMRLVEVVTHPAVDPEVVARATRLVTSWGKTAIRCSDAPGFIVNRVNRPFTLEALRILEAGEASISAIDEALRGAGFPMGPFELMDLVGIDVNLAAARGVWEGLGRPDRLAPSPIQERLVADGHLGRKADRGFYDYRDGQRLSPSDAFRWDAAATAAATTELLADRVVLAVVNEAYRAAGEGVATSSDIDLALNLGAGHPSGPFEWARGRGLTTVHRDLLRLAERHGDRFQPAPELAAGVGNPEAGPTIGA